MWNPHFVITEDFLYLHYRQLNVLVEELKEKKMTFSHLQD